MRRPLLAFALAALATACGEPASGAPPVTASTKDTPPMTATSFTSINGQPLDITGLGAKAILVVNTASKCGFTSQYKGLQELYEARKDDGLVIVGVPSNDFGAQEPGTEAEVANFCDINYGVTFPLTRKYAVSGAGQHPFFAAAVAALGEPAQPKWNFHKVLVSGDGTPLKAYPSSTRPADAELIADIDAALAG